MKSVPTGFDAQLDTFRQQLLLHASYEPALGLVDSAAGDIPVVLANWPPDLHGAKLPDAKVTARKLASALVRRGHHEGVSQWAIFRLIQRGFLGAEIATLAVPAAAAPANLFQAPDPVPAESTAPAAVSPDESSASDLLIWPQPALWTWWQSQPGAMLQLAPVEQLQDGPVQSLLEYPASGDFCWEGRLYNFTGRSWQLLATLWDEQRISFSELADQIWSRYDVPDSTVRSAVSRLNTQLAEHDIPLSWHVEACYVVRD